MNDLNVKDIRKELGLTQKELAKKLGVSEIGRASCRERV